MDKKAAGSLEGGGSGGQGNNDGNWLKPFLFMSSLLVARRQVLKVFAPR